MATLMNKRKIAAVSRDTPGMRVPRRFSHRTRLNRKWLKNTSPMFLRRSKGGQLKKLSNEFGRKEYRILGALSKLDKFLLNPQTRNCSVAVLGTSRNSNSENREPTGDRSLNDPCPEARFSSHHSGNLNSSDYPHTHKFLRKDRIILLLPNTGIFERYSISNKTEQGNWRRICEVRKRLEKWRMWTGIGPVPKLANCLCHEIDEWSIRSTKRNRESLCERKISKPGK